MASPFSPYPILLASCPQTQVALRSAGPAGTPRAGPPPKDGRQNTGGLHGHCVCKRPGGHREGQAEQGDARHTLPTELAEVVAALASSRHQSPLPGLCRSPRASIQYSFSVLKGACEVVHAGTMGCTVTWHEPDRAGKGGQGVTGAGPQTVATWATANLATSSSACVQASVQGSHFSAGYVPAEEGPVGGNTPRRLSRNYLTALEGARPAHTAMGRVRGRLSAHTSLHLVLHSLT